MILSKCYKYIYHVTANQNGHNVTTQTYNTKSAIAGLSYHVEMSIMHFYFTTWYIITMKLVWFGALRWYQFVVWLMAYTSNILAETYPWHTAVSSKLSSHADVCVVGVMILVVLL